MIHPAPKPPKPEKSERKGWNSTIKIDPNRKPLKRTPVKKVGKQKPKREARQRKFYASAEWKRTRKEALERAGNRCSYVEDRNGQRIECIDWINLHVHHKTYARFGGKELPEDLQVLCGKHHAKVELELFSYRHANRRRRSAA